MYGEVPAANEVTTQLGVLGQLAAAESSAYWISSTIKYVFTI